MEKSLLWFFRRQFDVVDAAAAEPLISTNLAAPDLSQRERGDADGPLHRGLKHTVNAFDINFYLFSFVFFSLLSSVGYDVYIFELVLVKPQNKVEKMNRG